MVFHSVFITFATGNEEVSKTDYPDTVPLRQVLYGEAGDGRGIGADLLYAAGHRADTRCDIRHRQRIRVQQIHRDMVP